jgi:hypothetical protein
LGDKCSSMWYRGSRGELENRRLICGASLARPKQRSAMAVEGLESVSTRTLASLAPKVYTCRCYQDVVDDCEAAFAAHPLPVFGDDARIVKDGSLV